MVTSIWYTREQVEAGEFLPQVNGVEIQPEQVNVISGYENGEQVNSVDDHRQQRHPEDPNRAVP